MKYITILILILIVSVNTSLASPPRPSEILSAYMNLSENCRLYATLVQVKDKDGKWKTYTTVPFFHTDSAQPLFRKGLNEIIHSGLCKTLKI